MFRESVVSSASDRTPKRTQFVSVIKKNDDEISHTCLDFRVMLFLSHFNQSQTFPNNPKHENSLKVYPMVVAVFHADK
jgi:hypothetical protein